METPRNCLLLLMPIALATGMMVGCTARGTSRPIERLDPALDGILALHTPIETLAAGYLWAEGPVWNAQDQSLLFSDVRTNVVYRWSPTTGVTVFLERSGTDDPVDPKHSMLGANGLGLDRNNCPLLCQHGNRRVIRLEADGQRTPIAERFEGKRFNSPNDIAVHPSGDIYFTDPCYGLKGFEKDPSREIPITGVFRIPAGGGPVDLVAAELMPNGIAFAPDNNTLYIANRRSLVACKRKENGSLGVRSILFSMEEEGELDGIAVDKQGTIFACNWRGSVYILSPEGRHLGTIRPGRHTANCEIGGPTGQDLFITAADALLRVHLQGPYPATEQ